MAWKEGGGEKVFGGESAQRRENQIAE